MFCTFCGKQLPDDIRFCTNCGKGQKTFQKSNTKIMGTKKLVNRFFDFINQWIDRFGGAKKIAEFSLPFVSVALIALRLFGSFLYALFFTACGIYLVFADHRERGKIDKKMILWVVVIFILGLIF